MKVASNILSKITLTCVLRYPTNDLQKEVIKTRVVPASANCLFICFCLFLLVSNNCWLCRDLKLYFNLICFIWCEWCDLLSISSKCSSSLLSSTSRMSKADMGNPKCLVLARMPKRSGREHCFRRSQALILTGSWKHHTWIAHELSKVL